MGLSVPPLPEDLLQELRTFLGDDWILIKNPIDTSVVFPAGWGYEELRRIFQLFADHPLFHILIADAGEWYFDSPEGVNLFHKMVDVCLEVAQKTSKPVVFVIRSGECVEEWRWQGVMAEQIRCAQASFPVFNTISRAARALSKFVHYYLT
jgi:hypothetical protein